MILRNNNKKHICDDHVDLIWNDEDDDHDNEDGNHHVNLIGNDEDDDHDHDDDVDDVVDDDDDDDDDDDGWLLSLETLPHRQCMYSLTLHNFIPSRHIHKKFHHWPHIAY